MTRRVLLGLLVALVLVVPAAANTKQDQKQIDKFAKHLKRSVTKAFKDAKPQKPSKAAARANTGTDIVVVPISNRTAGTYQFDGGAVPANLSALTVAINLNDADKLAVGKTLTLRSLFSTDGGAHWALGNETTWVSYGPGGLTVRDPDGTIRVNPDPRIQIGLSTRAGQQFRGEIVLPQALPAGATLSLK